MRPRALALALALGCSGEPVPEGLLVSGCKAWIPPHTCVAPEGRVTVWLPPGSTAGVVGGDVVERVSVDNGARTTVELPDGGELRVGGFMASVVRVSPGVCPAEGEPALSGGARGLCLESQASREWESGDLEAAVALHDEAVTAFEAAGWAREARMARLRIAFAEVEAGLPGRLPGGEGDQWDLAAHYMDSYVHGLRSALLGDHGGAARGYERAATLAARGDSARRLSSTVERQVELLIRLGRTSEAQALLPAVPSADAGPPCWAADRALGRAWALMELREATGGQAALGLDPWPFLRLASVDDPACAGRGREADLAVDVARAHLLDGAPARALEVLAEVTLADAPRDTARWRWELEGRARLAIGDAGGAGAAYAEALKLAGDDLEGQWSATVGSARAQAQAGAFEGALAAWDEALQRTDEHAAMVPLRIGKSTFIDQRTAAAADHAALLLQLGRPGDAFDAARRWRAQVIRSLAAGERAAGLSDTGMDDWTDVVDTYTRARRARAQLEVRRASAPRDELLALDAQLADAARREQEALDTGALLLGVEVSAPRDPAPGEVLVTWIREGGASAPAWRALVRDSRGVRGFAPVASTDPAALLAPLADTLRGADRVTLLAPSALEGLDLHAVDLDGAPLIAGREVVWSVDLGAPARPPGRGPPLVVADPGGGLAAARAEGLRVKELLVAGGYAPVELGSGTTDLQLLQSLGTGPVLLHYAGHGEARRGGLASRLLLADGAALNIADVLTLPVAPALVVLAGCETGRTLPLGVAEMGLAHAFVAAGSDAVVGTVRPVDDTLAAAFSVAFHRAGPLRVGPAAAFRAAVEAVRAEHPTTDWAAFRLVVR